MQGFTKCKAKLNRESEIDRESEIEQRDKIEHREHRKLVLSQIDEISIMGKINKFQIVDEGPIRDALLMISGSRAR